MSVINIVTHTDDSRGSIAFIRVCVWFCLSVCPQDKSKTAETTITKLATMIVNYETSPTSYYYIKRSKVKVTGSQSVKKLIEGDRVAGVSYTLYRVLNL